MDEEELRFNDDKVYCLMPLQRYGDGICKTNLVMTKEVFIECYKKWIEPQAESENNKMNKVIVRGDKSGVFFGTLVKREGREVELKDCRGIWYWEGAASINQLAVDGTACPNKCRFTVTVERIEILDAIEIIPCTDKAIKSIEGVKEWRI